MRKVLFKKWINAVENPAFDKSKEEYLQMGTPRYLKGTHCFEDDFSKEGYFHGFTNDTGSDFGATIESDGEILFVRPHNFKFVDTPKSEKRLDIAAMLMQGMLSNIEFLKVNAEVGRKNREDPDSFLSKTARLLADELIKQEEGTR